MRSVHAAANWPFVGASRRKEGNLLFAVTQTPPEPPGFLPANSCSPDPYLAYLAQRRTNGSRRAARGCLDRIARMLLQSPLDDTSVSGEGMDWSCLRQHHTVWIRQKIAEMDWKPAYQSKHLVALRGVLEQARRMKLIDGDAYQHALQFEGIAVDHSPIAQYIPDQIIGALLAVCANDPTVAGRRDSAMIAALDACGLRRGELVSLQITDYQQAAGTLQTSARGDVRRLVPVDAFAATLLDIWLAHRGRSPGPLFPRLERNGKIRTLRDRPCQMHPQAVYDIIRKRCHQADTDAIRPNDLRRTFISNLVSRDELFKRTRSAWRQDLNIVGKLPAATSYKHGNRVKTPDQLI